MGSGNWNLRVRVHGGLLVDKPSGPTSHDIVAFARRLLKTPRVGHTGTLDPLATGLLVLLVGRATRLSQFLVAEEKEYVADVRLGIATPTYDAQSLDEAEARGARRAAQITAREISGVLPDFMGTFPQLPPPFSAKKVAGVRAYEKARRHEAVELKPVEVTVRELELVDLGPPTSDPRPPTSDLRPPTTDLVRLRIVCSSGFYVRSLAHDLGQRLGCGGYLQALRRTRVGPFRVEDARGVDVLERAGPGASAWLISVNTLLGEMPAVTLLADAVRRGKNGNSLSPAHLSSPHPPIGAGARVRVLAPDGEVISVAEARGDGLLHPLLVLG